MGNASGPIQEAPSKVSVILVNLAQEINRLGESVANLRTRLVPVLTVSPATPAEEKLVPTPSEDSPLVASIESSIKQLERIRATVEVLHDTCEL